MSTIVPVYTQWFWANKTNNGSLRNWKRSNNRITFSCPFCGDSATDSKKARGNIFSYKNTLLYNCYNCSEALPFEAFLKKFNEVMYKEYKIENLSPFKKTPVYVIDNKQEKVAKTQIKEIDWKSAFLKCNTRALDYLNSRKIPTDGILWTENFKTSIVDLFDMYGKESSEIGPCFTDARIVFPFVVDGILTYIQGRSIDNSIKKSHRYMTSVINEGYKVFGFDKIKSDEDVFVTEGPVDSLFVINGIAVADANLTRSSQFINKKHLVLMYDNEPRSKIAIEKMKRALEDGFRVVILPDYIREKDLNEMFLVGYEPNELVRLYQYSGLTGLMRLKQWSKT